jgi:hypothetical protein
MAEQADEKIVHNLVEALERLRQDLDRVELWTGALGCFQRPVPPYEPNNRYLLSAKSGSAKSGSAKSASPKSALPKSASDKSAPDKSEREGPRPRV